jgi:hypothetical protein
MSKIIIKSVSQLTTMTKKPYLLVTSVADTKFKIWQDNQYIWHMFTEGASLDITFTEDKYGKVITGIVGVADQSGGISQFKTEHPATGQNGAGNAIEMIYEIVKRTEKKLDDLMADRILAKALEEEAKKDEDELPNL